MSLDHTKTKTHVHHQTLQPTTCLIAVEQDSRRIVCAGENAGDILERDAADLLGARLDDALGTQIWHDVANCAMHPDFYEAPVPLRSVRVGAQDVFATVFGDMSHFVLEFEPTGPDATSAASALKFLELSLSQFKRAQTEQQLLDAATHVLAFISGYPRVSVCKFDNDGNGMYVAATSLGLGSSTLGHFQQAATYSPAMRDALLKRTLFGGVGRTDTRVRVLQVAGTAVPDLSLASSALATGDTDAAFFDAGEIKTCAMLPLVKDAPWGYISFHSDKGQGADARLRSVLRSIGTVLALALR